jgi:anti-sigma factor RsiW
MAMRCADLLEWISAYADGQTTAAQTELVEAHLARCVECRAALARHRQVARLLRRTDTVDSWLVPDLRLRVAHATRGRRHLGQLLAGGMATGVAAAMLATGAAGTPAVRQVAAVIPSPAASSTICVLCGSRHRPAPLAARGPHRAREPGWARGSLVTP